MTVANENSRNDYVANGVTLQYAFTFKVVAEENIQVVIANLAGVETILALTADYSVDLDVDTGLGNVNLVVAPTSGFKISLLRSMDFEQNTEYQNQGTSQFPGLSHEKALDKLTLLCQQLKEAAGRTLTVKKTSALSGITVADPIPNRILVVDSNGDISMSDSDFTDLEADIAEVVAISDEIVIVAGIASSVAAVALVAAAVATVAGIASAVSTVAAISGNVSTVAGISGNVSTVAGISSQIQSVVTNLSSILNAASFGFPTVSAGDVGKLLRVNPTFNGYVAANFTVAKQTFTASGTYTPTSGMVYGICEAWGGGGAGGGVAGATGQTSGAGGGGAGAYSKHLFTAADIGASKAVTIGAAGAAGAAGNNAGGNGGTTSLGSLCTAPGGTGGGGAPGNGGGGGGAGGIAGTANMVAGFGANGLTGMGSPNITGMYALGGAGASSGIGGGGVPSQTAGTQTGVTATGKASGGSGGAVQNSTSTVAGGLGTIGYMVITEFILA